MRRFAFVLLGSALAVVAACDASSAGSPDASADAAADGALDAFDGASQDATSPPIDASDASDASDAALPDCPVAADDPRWDGGAFDAAACGVKITGCQAEMPADFACRLLDHAGPNGATTYPCVVCPKPLPCGPAPYCIIFTGQAQACDPDAGTYTMRCGSGA